MQVRFPLGAPGSSEARGPKRSKFELRENERSAAEPLLEYKVKVQPDPVEANPKKFSIENPAEPS